MSSTRRLVFLALLIAMGSALHLAEAMLPLPLPVPGLKLGLANIVTLLALGLFGIRGGLTVAVGRVFIGSLLGGAFFSPGFFLGLSGAVASTLVMALLLDRTSCFSLVGISLAGAVTHNIGQILAAALLLQNSAIFAYLPVLLLASLPTGLFTGFVLKSLQERLDRTALLPDLART